MNKLQQMNKWRAELKAEGVSVPKGTGYDEMRSLHRKHCGSGGANGSASVGAAGKRRVRFGRPGWLEGLGE